ncbi:MAG: 4'-phosphopantetheinyl transferase superfamily protein [Burkholderiaceae bacterium]|nr:4'-phosphopantetheinyl transferase superfamily protein [Burkholderiaceae bacterium]
MTVSVLITPEFALPARLEAQWLQDLPLARRTQISAWPDPQVRHRSLIGSRLLDHGLRRLGFAGDVLATLRHPPTSRPTLTLPVDFSLSHGDGRVVCAISTQGTVGIDVEAVGQLVAEEFQLYLSAAERAWAGRSSRRFYSVWTRKEAVVKAASEQGLREVARVDTTPGERLAAYDGRLWHTLAVPVGRRHVAHLALAALPRELAFHRVASSVLERGTSATAAVLVR